MNFYKNLSTWLFLIFLISAFGCSENDQSIDTVQAEKIFTTLPVNESYTETGDLPAVLQHKQLRILIMPLNELWLPRNGNSFNAEQEMAIKLAEQINLKPVFVHVKKFEDLIPALIEGLGDIIAANLTITQSRKQQVQFSVPLNHSIEHIVTRTDDGVGKLKGLSTRTVAFKASSSYEATIEKIRKKHPKIKTHIIAGNLSTDQILDLLVQKKIDVTVLDSSLLDVLAGYRDDFKVSLALTGDRAIAWGIRKDNPLLLKAINKFLTHEQLTQRQLPLHIDDLKGIKKRKTLRVITRNNAASYFLWRGELMGFEYDMVSAFAKENGLRLEVISAPYHKDQIPMLVEGKGDIIASFMSITDKRLQQDIKFSRAHHKASEVIVSRIKEEDLNEVIDLVGRSIYVRKSSSYWESLEKLQASGIDFKLVAAPENMETEEIISRVASGEFDLTLADNHLLDIELTWRDDIKSAFVIGEERQSAWAVRNNNPELLKAINQFLKKQHRSLFYNVTYEKYFKNPRRIKKYREDRIDLNPDGTLSPFDSLIKKYAQQYDFDWRLLVAQMYQESKFNPKAKSWVGALGLMQVMPRTAKEMGIKNLKQPEQGIMAGVRYLGWVRDRFEPDLDVKERMWFTLAAYNAGQGHVKDARRLARQRGLNPNKWFDHTEKTILLLSKRKYFSKARHGYVRGTEPVNYVRKIRNRYRAYLRLADQQTMP